MYPDNGAGTPDLTKPIASLNPVIDPAIPAEDQRFTIDYRAGVIRFSCAPALGGDIKVAGGVNPTTGRLNLYAVFMAFDQTQTQGTARGLYGVRTLNYGREPARIVYDQTTDSWRLTQNEQGDDLFTQAVGPDTDYRRQVKIGALSTGSVEGYFVYDIDRNRWRFANHSSVVGTDPAASMEMEVGQKTALTVGDISAPPLAPADLNALGSARGARDTSTVLELLRTSVDSGYGVVHLRRGKYNLSGTLHVPPGITLEGEGNTTVIEYVPRTGARGPALKFGPNTRYGVYDFSYDGVNFYPTRIATPTTHVEGVDVVWNSVRRVWAIFWADAATNRIMYEEVDQAGQRLFDAPLDVKSSLAALFVGSTSARAWHTTGHYPRVAFHEPTDTYAVAWVETQTLSGETGPKAVFKVIQTDLDTREVRPAPLSSSYTTVLPTQEMAVGVFTTHPSVGASDDPLAPTAFAFSYWNFGVGTVSGYKVPSASKVGAVFVTRPYSHVRSQYEPADPDFTRNVYGRFGGRSRWVYVCVVTSRPSCLLRVWGEVTFGQWCDGNRSVNGLDSAQLPIPRSRQHSHPSSFNVQSIQGWRRCLS